jgi:hypothetical protein
VTTARRKIDDVIKCLGCRPIDQYSSADAAKHPDLLLEKGLASSSVKRVFSSVKTIVNLVINERLVCFLAQVLALLECSIFGLEAWALL